MDKTLSICIFSNLYPPITSGSSSFTWELSRRLTERGHRVVVVTAQVDDLPPYEEQDDVIIHRMPAMRLPQMALAHNFKWLTYTFLPKNLRWLRTLFETEKFDVIHQQNHIFDTILSSPRMAKRFNIPLLLTMHTYAQHSNPVFNWILAALDVLARQVIINKADVVVSTDPAIQRYVQTRHKVAQTPLIPYGIDVPKPDATLVEEIRSRYHLAGKSPLILSLGHVIPLRNRLDLIGAMPGILKQFPDAHLLIVGELYTQKPVELVAQLGIGEHVTFTGSVPHTDVAAFFELVDVEAHTFAGSYPGPGIASMEAMATGLPVVTGKIAPEYNFEFLHNGQNIVMVEPDNSQEMEAAVIRLLSDRTLSEEIGRNAQQTIAKHYTWEIVCKAYEDLYAAAIANNISKQPI